MSKDLKKPVMEGRTFVNKSNPVIEPDLPPPSPAKEPEKTETVKTPVIENDNGFVLDDDMSSLFDEISSSSENVEIAIDNEVKQDNNIKDAKSEAVSGTTKSKTPITSKMAANGAKMYVFTVNVFMSKLCAVISDEKDDQQFRLSKSDEVAYIKVSESFFKSVNLRLDPYTLFIIFTLAIFGGSFWRAHKIRKEKILRLNKQAERAKKAEERAKETGKTQLGLFPDLERVELPKEPDEEVDFDLMERKNYEVDENGYWTKDLENKYIKKSDRYEKAPDQIVQWNTDGLTSKQIKELVKKMNHNEQ